MKLRDLLDSLERAPVLPGDLPDREVQAVAHDSRKVVPGTLFVAVRGFHADGHRFIPQAVRQGAIAVVAEEGGDTGPSGGAPVIHVPDSRRALARLAANFYGYPSRRIRVVGITGTKGKTTTSYLVKSVIEAAGRTAGLIGTIDYRIGGKVYPAPNTTPESLDLQAFLAEMADLKTGYCVMEVSSHALALGRTDGCVFEAAAFTNLAHDHLDFHDTLDDYFQAKLLLFTGLGPDKLAVVNIDDERSAEIVNHTKARVITFGFSGNADVRPKGNVSHGINGLSFTTGTPAGDIEIQSPLVGKHNIYNILTAVALGVGLGFSAGTISTGIGRMQSVPGRMEKVDEGQPFGVLVDYAHTEGSLASLLDAVRGIAARRVITVFGCGGDRDRTKRPKMGAAALNGSDVVIVTSDNPRTEDPLAIIREIEGGMSSAGARVSSLAGAQKSASGGTPYLVIPDRGAAIAAAVGIAEPGDVVVLAGKGHEDYQIIGQTKIHFDDREIAREEIRRRQKTEDRGQRTEESKQRTG
jgi:UDP-N-acetylmuramoyl-L-alanyl-D-glutamate--2,6-diaminopimelate ligase